MVSGETKTVRATVSLSQIDTRVLLELDFATVEAADAFFDECSSDHLDKGVITIRTERGSANAG